MFVTKFDLVIQQLKTEKKAKCLEKKRKQLDGLARETASKLISKQLEDLLKKEFIKVGTSPQTTISPEARAASTKTTQEALQKKWAEKAEREKTTIKITIHEKEVHVDNPSALRSGMRLLVGSNYLTALQGALGDALDRPILLTIHNNSAFTNPVYDNGNI